MLRGHRPLRRTYDRGQSLPFPLDTFRIAWSRTVLPPAVPLQAVVRCADPEDGNESDNEEGSRSSGAHRALVVSHLNQLWKASCARGDELRLWMQQKWGKRYVMHLKRRASGLVLEISGFNMEDGTARLCEEAYALHLQKVCTQLRSLGVRDVIGTLEAASLQEPRHFIGVIDSPAEIPLRLPHACEAEWLV